MSTPEVTIPDSATWATARQVAETLAAAGHEALFAGGAVRDLLLGRDPVDVDVATSAHPSEVEAIFPKVVTVGAQFGVCKVIHPPFEVEVATFRVDGPYSDGRRPDSVSWASDREDALRRDFTMNGLFLDPGSGRVLDYVEGVRDLEAGIIRAIGDPAKRFEEDKLRMMRAVRFSAQLEFAIEEETGKAIREMAGRIRDVSAERIRDELIKILMSPRPAEGIRLLKAMRLLREILPEVEAMEGVEQPPEFHPEGDVFVHTMLLLDATEGANLDVKLGALLHDVGKPATFERKDRIRFNRHERVGADMAEAILERLRFSREQKEHVVRLVDQHMKFPALPQMRPAKLKRFLAQPRIQDHLELHRIDCLASHGNLQLYEFAKKELEELGAQGVDPPPLLQGRDLIAMGYPPGPRFSTILERVRDAQLEGEIGSDDEARRLVETEFPLA